jgi:hypothetical protein
MTALWLLAALSSIESVGCGAMPLGPEPPETEYVPPEAGPPRLRRLDGSVPPNAGQPNEASKASETSETSETSEGNDDSEAAHARFVAVSR